MELYQIPASVGVSAQLNADLANIQKRDAELGASDAFNTEYSEFVADYPGDLDAGKIMPGTTLNRNAMTQVQCQIYDAKCLGGVVPAGLDIQGLLDANPGPGDYGNWWNWSYGDFGLDPTIAPDASLTTATVVVVENGAAKAYTGLLSPKV